jgi:hypothetical protein
MGNRTAKFVSALIGSIVAGAPLAAVSQNAPSAPSTTASTANAASDCLASPKGTAPQGQHWFYRVERGTKRQCWYLRAEGAKAATSAQTANNAQQPDSAPPQSVQNAHAEYIAPQSGAAQAAQPGAPVGQPATNSDPQQPAVATRWPDSTAATAAPAPQPAAAPATAAAEPSPQPAASPAPVALAAADAPAEKPTGSVQMLLLVIGGALALAGLLASVIFRFAGGRGRAQTADRRVNWDHRQDHDDSRAPWHNERVPAPRVERPLPVDFDAVRPAPPQIAAFTDAIGRIASQARPTHVASAEPVEADVEFFDGEFEIETSAPQLAAGNEHNEHKEPDFDIVRPQARQIAAFTDEIRKIALQGRPAAAEAEPDDTEIDYFDGEFEIEAAAPQLVADDIRQEEPAAHDADAHEETARDDNAVDIDIITAMLERLASEGPRLTQPSLEPSLEADLAALARSSRGPSAARA